ncbi:hypothetical protein [Halomonas sp.]|uniref:hypothetical protein n=1 Tax=Halomonas sp. TaxID=1486246 RepID=UPI0035626A2D
MEQHNHPTMTQRYSGYSGSGTGSGNSKDFDDITLKLQKYSAIRVNGKRVNAFDSQYGDKFVIGFDDVEVLDGIVFQRDDKANTWKVFSPGKFFNVDPDTGKVYEQAEEDENEMSAQDILEHPRVLGFSETFGSDDYFYTPVGVVLEATEDIAMNEDIDVESTDEPTIVVGEVSMLLSNKSWVRTLAKLLTEQGNNIIEKTENEDGNEVAVTESHGWLTTMDPELRAGIAGREMELFIIEETQDFNGEEVTYTTPILLDSKTGERITIDNLDGEGDDDAQEAEEAPADDADTSDDDSPTDESEADEAADTDDEGDDETGSVEGEFPDELESLLDYFAKTDGTVEPDELRSFGEDEVENPDDVDWELGAKLVEERA